MTKTILLERAKALGITGRHDLTKEELETAVRQREMIDATKPKKNLVKRTNIPWRRKFYFLDLDRYNEQSEAVKKSATQVQLILKSMITHGLTSEGSSEMGATICSKAIADGMQTKIMPNVLFAYYRSEMEHLGLVFAGYNIDR